MDADFRHFNALGPKEQARLIIAAGAKARGRAAPQLDQPEIDANDPQALAAAIVRAGRKARGQQE